jgi:hypothetical protein
MKLRDTSNNPFRVYWVVTQEAAGRAVIKTKMSALTTYRQLLREGAFPLRLERFRLSAKHLDGLIAHGSEYFDDLVPDLLLREYDGIHQKENRAALRRS